LGLNPWFHLVYFIANSYVLKTFNHVIGSILNMIWKGGDFYDSSIRKRVFTSTMNKIFLWTLNNMEKIMATTSIWIANQIAVIVCFTSFGEMGAGTESVHL
jgi:hypothetical protein